MGGDLRGREKATSRPLRFWHRTMAVRESHSRELLESGRQGCYIGGLASVLGATRSSTGDTWAARKASSVLTHAPVLDDTRDGAR